MAGETEAGDVGQPMHAAQVGERDAGLVEHRRRLDQLCVAFVVELALLQRRRQHADAERLAENQHVAGPRIGIAPNLLRMHQAHHDEAINRLDRIDRVAAGDRDPGIAARRFTAADDLPDHVDRQLVDRHRDERERHDRLAAHRVDVADRVGRGNAAEVVRLIDDRREEVGRGDDRLRVVQPIDRGVVRRLEADHEVLRQPADRRGRQDLGEDSGRDLAAAAAAMRKAGEADRS